MSRGALERRIADLPPAQRDLLLDRLRERQAPAPPRSPALVPRPADRFDPFPLSEIQRVYWIGRQGVYDLSGGGTNAYLELELVGFRPQRAGRLAAAFRRLIARHDNLRTVLLADGRQRVLETTPPWGLPVVDLRELPAAAAAKALATARRRLRYDRFPLGRFPLFDFRAHLLAGDRLRLMLRVETALVDGDSREVFFGELFAFYADPARRLPSPAVTYRDVVLAVEQARRGPSYAAARRHWLERLETLPPPPALPWVTGVGPATAPRQVNRQGETLSAAGWRELRRRGGERRLTPSALLAAAFAAALARAGAGDAFTLGLVGTERPPIHPAIGRLLGNFNRLTLLPVTTTGSRFAERAAALQEELRRGLDHALFTGSEVLRELGRRRPGGGPPCPVAFNSLVEVHGAEAPRPAADLQPAPPELDFIVELVDAGIYVPNLALLMTSDDFGGALHCRSQAAEHLFPAGWVAGVYDGFVDLLRRLASGDEAWEQPFAAAGRDGATAPPSGPRAARPSRDGLSGGRPASGRPASETETREWVGTAWRELLGAPPRGDGDDFFASGGDSFTLARLASRAAARWGEGTIDWRGFFERPTPAGLAALIEGGAS